MVFLPMAFQTQRPRTVWNRPWPEITVSHLKLPPPAPVP